MSTMINIGPLIAKVSRDMLEEQGTVLDIDSVYSKLISVYGNQIFESERMLAEVAIRQKIKHHLKHAHSINGDDGGDQLSLIKDDAPATLSVKQADGGYAYVPLLLATIDDLDAVTKAKRDNIENVQTSLQRWEEATAPIRAVMDTEKVTFGEAQKLIAERAKKAPPVQQSA